ncbi:MAG TPA: glycosyltransferase family 2 protein, partial [Polyangiales bacterium]
MVCLKPSRARLLGDARADAAPLQIRYAAAVRSNTRDARVPAMSVAAMSLPSVSIVVFAYNEAENLGPVLGELREWLQAHQPQAEVVFVDDGSQDATLDSAKAALAGFRAKFLRHEKNRGIGAALKTGVKVCESPWVTFLPADGQIEPAAIGTLLTAARSANADLVLSTYDHRDDGLDRKLLSFGMRALIYLVHGVKLQCEGPYLFRSSIFVPEELPA